MKKVLETVEDFENKKKKIKKEEKIKK